MSSPFDAIFLNTKLVTAALLLLNFLLLTSLYLGVKWARAPKGDGTQFGKRQQGIVFGMLLSVIALNGFAVYTNNSLQRATETLIDHFAGADFAAPMPAPAGGALSPAAEANDAARTEAPRSVVASKKELPR